MIFFWIQLSRMRCVDFNWLYFDFASNSILDLLRFQCLLVLSGEGHCQMFIFFFSFSVMVMVKKSTCCKRRIYYCLWISYFLYWLSLALVYFMLIFFCSNPLIMCGVMVIVSTGKVSVPHELISSVTLSMLMFVWHTLKFS